MNLPKQWKSSSETQTSDMSQALLIVDMQNYFITPHTAHLPEKIKAHIVLYHNTYAHILFSRFINTKDSNFVRSLGWNNCIQGTETEIHPDLIPFTAPETVFTKHGFSAFHALGLSEFLQENHVTTLSICGTDTDACVYATAMDAFEKGYITQVLFDLCGSHRGKEWHELGMRLIKANLLTNPSS